MEVDIKLVKTIEAELTWLQSVIDTRLTLYFKNKSKVQSIDEILPPNLKSDDSPYAIVVNKHELDYGNRLVLILSLAPYLRPNLLDVFLIKNQNLNIDFSEFGGLKDGKMPGFRPTMETAAFILSGNDLSVRYQFLSTLTKENPLFLNGIMSMDTTHELGLHEPLAITPEYFSLFIHGKKSLPQFGAKFPAKQIESQMIWEELVLERSVKGQLTEIKHWLEHSDLILNNWGLNRNLKLGYRALFFGPPGTGKTLAATLIGKDTKLPVFRVDLSLVVSKYIGETEKNLGKLFDEAEDKNWILFFDEADALFGKRTQTKGSNDRYANQEVSYLLQRIENYNGLVILATNNEANMDEAFSRRFQSMIHFPKPGVKEREVLWGNLFKNSNWETASIDFKGLASKYELTGGELINILRYCALQIAKRKEDKKKDKLELSDIITGIRREYNKQDKTL